MTYLCEIKKSKLKFVHIHRPYYTGTLKYQTLPPSPKPIEPKSTGQQLGNDDVPISAHYI